MKTINKLPRFTFKKTFNLWLLLILSALFSLPIYAQVNKAKTAYKSLNHYWSSARKDNFSTASTKGIKAAKAAKYRFVRKDGFVLTKGTSTEGKAVPLYLFYSKARKDYLTVASSAGIRSAKSAGYIKIGIEGYILQTVNKSSKHLYKPLWLYYNAARKDNFTIASSTGINTAKAGGYKKVRIEGYVRINNKRQETKVIVEKSDPFTRLKKEARKSATKKIKGELVTISDNNLNFKLNSKPKIPFVPFKLEDENGNPVSPSKIITLKNGKTITAQKLVEKTNEIEAQLNERGYSIRNDKEKLVAKLVTDRKFLDGKISQAPQSIRPLRTVSSLNEFMKVRREVKVPELINNPFKKKKTFVLKPFSSYTQREKAAINNYDFSVNTNSGKVIAKHITKPRRFKDFRTNRHGELLSLEEIDKTDTRKWSFGNPETFYASIEGSLHRYAKIYPYDPNNTTKNKSEFKVFAQGVVKGSVLGSSMELLNGTAEFHAPSDVSKNMTAKIQVKVFGTTIFNPGAKSFPQTKSFSKIHANSFDWSHPINYTVFPGLDLVADVGVSGEIGLSYNAKIQKTFVEADVKPIAKLNGYIKVGAEFLQVLGAGVVSDLVFLDGHLELNAHAGIFYQNADTILIGVNHYFGYDLNILNGELSAYIEACIPFTDKCTNIYEEEIFKWTGYEFSGTVSEKQINKVLDNVVKYEEGKVLGIRQ